MFNKYFIESIEDINLGIRRTSYNFELDKNDCSNFKFTEINDEYLKKIIVK